MSKLYLGDPLDFVRDLKTHVDGLHKNVQGLLARFGQRYGYDEGVPHACVGERVFEPEDSSFTLDLLGRGDDAATKQPVQYVVRDGIEFSVPVDTSSVGVFHARFLNVSFYQRWWSAAQNREFWFPIPIGRSFDHVSAAGDGTKVQTVKWSVMHSQTFQTWPNVLNTTHADAPASHQSDVCGINFFWNLLDQSGQRYYSNNLVPDVALRQQGYHGQDNGGMLSFRVPWTFDRQGQLDFVFRLVNPILQLAPTATLFPFTSLDGTPLDDRENGGASRRQSVKVRVELHGSRFFSQRDIKLMEAP